MRTICSLVIPPLSESLVKVKIDDHYRWQTSIIEPIANLSSKRLALARCIVSPKSPTVLCKVLNPTLASVYLKKHSKIGTIEPVDVDSNNVHKQTVNVIETNTDKNGGSKNTSKTNFQSPEEILNELGIKIEKDSLSEGDYFKLVNFLAKNQDVFAKSLADLPGTDLILHKIDTGDAPPFRQRMFRTTPEARKEISRQTEEMLKMGIIRESDFRIPKQRGLGLQEKRRKTFLR